MAIQSVDAWLASTKVQLPFSIASISNATAGIMMSLWKAAGQYPPAATTPTSAAVPDDASSGYSFTNPSSPAKSYLGFVGVVAAVPGQLVLFDRLSHTGGLSGTSTSAQTTNLPTAAINRGDTTGLGVEGFLEWYSDTGSTATTATVSYTDDAGNTGNTSGSIALAATRRASMMLPIPLAAGDKGIRAVASVTLAASTLTAGNFGVTLCRRLATIAIPTANIPVQLDAFSLGLPQVNDDACLMWGFIPSSTTTGQFNGGMVLGQG